MAWTAPMTAVPGTAYTAAQYNTFVRDNTLECPTAKMTGAGHWAATDRLNSVSERIPATQTLSDAATTTSSAWGDLLAGSSSVAAVYGPVVTVTTGTSALIVISAECRNTVISNGCRVGVDMSGATNRPPSTLYCLRQESSGTSEFQQCSSFQFHNDLTPGITTFTLKYSTPGGSASFNIRSIIVMPF